MKTAWKRYFGTPLLILIVGVGVLAGCASVFQDLDNRMHRNRFKSDFASLDRIMTEYDKGRYAVALAGFSALQSTSASQKIVRRAWLGEICCRLLLAKTPADYTAAIGLWHDFARTETDRDPIWDPDLIDPLIVRMIPNASIDKAVVEPSPTPSPPTKTTKPATVKKPQPVERIQRDPQLEAELAALKKKAEAADQLQRRLDEVVAENDALKDKIKALEAIDQNMRKKKTEISAPSE